MMKKKIHIFVCVIAFCCIFTTVYAVVNETLRLKYDNGILPLQDLYHYPENSIDVIFLGSSHIGMNVDTEVLCRDYGIAAYKIWGPIQPVWNSYFNLVEALKTQKPKLVVFETLSMSHTFEHQTYAHTVMNLSGMKLSLNKIQDILVSAEPQYYSALITNFSLYHTRYNELTAQDFENYFWNYQYNRNKNFHYEDHAVYAANAPELTSEKLPLGEKQRKYFLKLYQLCKRNDIPLLLVTVPYSIIEDESARQNTFSELAREKGLAHLDFKTVSDAIDIQYNGDFIDDSGHFNNSGIEKFTRYIGTFMRQNYDLPERYDDPYFAYSTPSNAVFYLHKPFIGDAQTGFIDTKATLFDDPTNSWTILSRINTQCNSPEKIYYSCFSEAEPYRGLLVRGTDNGQLDVVIGSNYYCKLDLPDYKKWVTLAISKNGDHYNIYLDGKCAYKDMDVSCDTYEKSLVIGAQWLANNQLGKLSAVMVDKFELYYDEMSASDICKWMNSNAYIPSQEEMEKYYQSKYTHQIEYTLDAPFAGNGTDYYLDTNIQLYMEPQRNWTLFTELEIPFDNASGVYLSCFREVPGEYRGLLIRKVDNTLQLLVGNSCYITYDTIGSSKLNVVITKFKSTYTAFINGSPIATVDSECASYVGPLLIGAELDENYMPINLSQLAVNRLEIREGVASTDEIAAWNN